MKIVELQLCPMSICCHVAMIVYVKQPAEWFNLSESRRRRNKVVCRILSRFSSPYPHRFLLPYPLPLSLSFPLPILSDTFFL